MDLLRVQRDVQCDHHFTGRRRRLRPRAVHRQHGDRRRHPFRDAELCTPHMHRAAHGELPQRLAAQRQFGIDRRGDQIAGQRLRAARGDRQVHRQSGRHDADTAAAADRALPRLGAELRDAQRGAVALHLDGNVAEMQAAGVVLHFTAGKPRASGHARGSNGSGDRRVQRHLPAHAPAARGDDRVEQGKIERSAGAQVQRARGAEWRAAGDVDPRAAGDDAGVDPGIGAGQIGLRGDRGGRHGPAWSAAQP